MVPKGDPELGRGLWKCFFAHVLESFEEVSFTGPKGFLRGLGLEARDRFEFGLGATRTVSGFSDARRNCYTSYFLEQPSLQALAST